MQFLLDELCETRKSARAPIPQFRSLVTLTLLHRFDSMLRGLGLFFFELSWFFVERVKTHHYLEQVCRLFAYCHQFTACSLLDSHKFKSNSAVVQTLMSSRALKLSSQSLGRDSSMSSTDRPLRRSLRAMQLR